MKYTKTEEKLMSAMSEMDIIDCHEHLPPEEDRLKSPQDVFTLFSHYTRHDLFSAGLDQKEYEKLYDYSIPIEERWKKFKPYYETIKYGSYARAALLTARMFYGFDDINDETYKPLSAKIAAENTPGLYKRVLVDRCRIKASLTQCGRTNVGRPLVPLLHIPTLANISSKENVDALLKDFGPVKHLDDYLALCRLKIEKWIAEGIVGLKMAACYSEPPDRGAAISAFDGILRGQKLQFDRRGFHPLQNYLLSEILEIAAELNLTVAVHAGIWGDFRNLDGKHMLQIAPAHPGTTFDRYHLSMPSVRDAIVVGKNLANVNLNLCWIHIISQIQSCSGINELLDMVPMNKVLAFGGDYGRPVEKVIGHLHMAREDFARVFGARIDHEEMDTDDALNILRLWFWDNPQRVYKRLSAFLADG
ncbi:MAG TPA: amidohydrolase family protein [Candidatus Brocadiia bacterium]|nr:amidohydrolase family protein [Candidatus Brocadiia bacterium]